MATTKSPLSSDPPGTEVAHPPDVSSEGDEAATSARRAKAVVQPHRNEIVVVGELSPPVEPSTRANGQEVLSFRVAVRTATTGRARDPAASGSRDAVDSSRRDILDCVVGSAAMRRRLEAYRPGDVVELAGSLRHRFWNTAGRVQSRYEIEVSTLKRLARAGAARGSGT